METDALIAALVELERYVSALGYDQPPRLFALADARAVIAREPHLVTTLGRDGEQLPPGALLAIEQDEFSPGADLPAALAQISWPPEVAGCAVTMVSTFVPPEAAGEMPEESAAAADWVSQHPQRQDLRVAVGVLRDGSAHGLARMATHPEELLGGRDLVPGLITILAHTLDPESSTEEF